MKTYCKHFVFVVVVLLSSMAVFSVTANTDGYAFNTEQLVVIEDSYVDSFAPDSNFNAQSLAFEYGTTLMDGDYCPAVTKISYMKFDLSQIDFPISKAQLSLGQGDCSSTETLPIQLFAANSTWDETALTWNTQPQAIYGFTEIPTSQNAVYHWNDSDMGNTDGLADWLAQQQQEGTMIITLGMVMSTFMGCGSQTIEPITVVFNDRERTASSERNNCANFDIIPTLQVTDANARIVSPELTPTVVTIFTSSAESFSSSALFASLFALIVTTLFFCRHYDETTN